MPVMVTVRDSVHLRAPRQQVFALLDEPERQSSFTASLKESTLVERLSNGGARARYVFSVLGIDLEGEVEATDYDPPSRIVWAMRGDLRGTIRWYLDPDGGGTRFTYAATYQVPGPRCLRSLTRPIVRRYNERVLRQTMDTLRAHFAAQM